MKTALTLMGIAFTISLAIIVGNRLSAEAQAVMVGAICGITASIPVTVGLLLASQWQTPKPPEPQYPQGQRIVIVPNRYDENRLMIGRPRDD